MLRVRCEPCLGAGHEEGWTDRPLCAFCAGVGHVRRTPPLASDFHPGLTLESFGLYVAFRFEGAMAIFIVAGGHQALRWQSEEPFPEEMRQHLQSVIGRMAERTAKAKERRAA